ncbi:MAG: acyl carrier protein [Eubacteriales bacterium]|jgi:acyl carrier protein
METREDILKGIFGRVSYLTGKDEASLDESTTFESLNLKSVNYSQITTYLEDELDVEVPYMGFRKNKTIGEAADYVFGLLD